MTAARAGLREPASGAGAEAFRHALRYALTVTQAVTPELMPRPTPCRGWDLGMLITHAAESLAALTEGFDDGAVARAPGGVDADAAADPREAFQRRAHALLDSLAGHAHGQGRDVVTVGGCPMAADLLATTGALEVAVHGWDIARACGNGTPIPAQLAADLLDIAPLLITPADRQQLFAAPVDVAGDACPSDRLAGFLGRSPFT